MNRKGNLYDLKKNKLVLIQTNQNNNNGLRQFDAIFSNICGGTFISCCHGLNGARVAFERQKGSYRSLFRRAKGSQPKIHFREKVVKKFSSFFRVDFKIITFLRIFEFEFKMEQSIVKDEFAPLQLKCCGKPDHADKHSCVGHPPLGGKCTSAAPLHAHRCAGHTKIAVERVPQNYHRVREEFRTLGRKGYVVDLRPLDEMINALKD